MLGSTVESEVDFALYKQACTDGEVKSWFIAVVTLISFLGLGCALCCRVVRNKQIAREKGAQGHAFDLQKREKQPNSSARPIVVINNSGKLPDNILEIADSFALTG